MSGADFAERWIAAWNARDLEAVLSHYSDEIVFSSPLAKTLTGKGEVVGIEALRAYWTKGLALNPDLAFTLEEVLAGDGAVTLLYRNQHGRRVAETLAFDETGKVRRAGACYGAEPARPADPDAPLALIASEVAPRAKASNYPAPFAARMAGRTKRVLGDRFGIKAFGVNLTTLDPGAVSALLHRHSVQDEFVYVLEGEVVLVADRGEAVLTAGMCAGFAAAGVAHQLVNRSNAPATYLEIGDRAGGDSADYPADDLVAKWADGGWRFTHKDGTPYPRND